ncbi:MAG TPA: DUF5719 family protein [Actinomycetota bacterium]|nr:DUF5719 family protein [Actinomycetota bacterium]
MNASREGSTRGQALFALASVAFMVVALTWLDRAGPRVPAQLAGGEAPSGAWICPHGGGRGLSVALFLANPGEAAATVRLTQLGAEVAGPPARFDVAGGTTLRVDLAPGARGDATSVEFFGGWIGVGWVSFTDAGAAAEPCAAEASQRWYLADGSTELGEESYVVVANPFSGPAVMDVVLYSADRPPVRQSEWTDLVVPAGRSVALHLNEHVKGEPVVTTALDVSVGRVAAASLVVSDRTTVRSAIGWTRPATGAWFPMMKGSGQNELVLVSTASASIRFGATSLSEDQPRPAGGLTEQEHGPTAARAYAIPEEDGPAAVRLFTLDGALVSGALRVLGPGTDLGSTGGSVSASDAWVLFPASARIPAEPGALLVNDGDVAVAASVELLPEEGVTPPSSISISVPPHATAAVPPDLWAAAPGSTLVVRAEGPILALSAASSQGSRDAEAFALSMGVPLPLLP